jgi:hypothetical protein
MLHRVLYPQVHNNGIEKKKGELALIYQNPLQHRARQQPDNKPPSQLIKMIGGGWQCPRAS